MKKLMCQPATMEGVQEKTRTGSNTKSSVKPKKKAKHTDERPLSSVVGDLVALEPRIMFDGAALATGAEVLQDTTTQDATTIPGVDGETATDSSSAESADEALWSSGLSLTAPSDRKEIVFIDTGVDDYQALMEGIDPNAEVILLDSTRDGIEQIAEILGERTDIDAVHVISHGDSGELQLGTGVLNITSMQGEYADELATINQALTEEADFLIYGCNFGEGESGVEASTLLAELTGADIAASSDLTGAEALGGDWELEVQTGTIESEVIVDQQAQESFAGVLDITTGLVGHWTFDADATDSSGNSYDGTLTGDASIDTTDATDIVGEGKLALDGTGDYVNLDTHISGFSGLTEGTISAWVKMTDTGESTIFGLSDKDEASELIKFGIEGGQLKWLNLNPAFDDVIVYSTATVNDGAWHHVAVTVNSSGNTLYIDGAVASVSYSSGSSSTTAFFDDITNIDALDIGRSVRGGVAEAEYDGLTDDVRVYNRALSAADIAELATEAPVANNDSATTDMNTAVNIDLTANDTDLDNETITVLDVSNPTNGTVVNNEDGTVTYTPNTSYTGADSFTYLTADLDDTTSYWRLDGDATDAVGSNDGTITGTTTVEGHFGDALSFDEVDDKVVISDFAMNNEFSISFKIKIDDNTGSLFQYIYSHGDIDSTNSLNIFLNEASHVTDPNMLRTVIRDTNDTLSNTALQFDASSIIGDGNWHTYTLTVATGEGAKVYLDGVLQNTDVTRGGDAFDPGTDLYLGTRQDEAADRWYGGSLDSVQVFNRALSASEVTATHTGGSSLGTVNVTIDPTLVVDTTSDVLDGDTSSISALFASKGADGFISLREAIEAANNTAGTDTISFDISDPLVGGAHTIDVLSALPDITDAVIIDGTSEPDYGSTPIIELDGSSAGAVDGLRLITGSDGSTIQGLVINQFGGDGIEINNSDGNTVVGNYIGTDVTGTVDLGNASAGIRLSSTQNNIIGGTTVTDRNLISGNEGSGIFRLGANGGNVIQGNYIGTDVTGTLDLGNTQNGIAFAGSGVDTIGGNVAGAGNLISGNNMDGISIGAGANGVIIQGNYIGTNAAGTGAIANTGDGIAVNADNTQIGGTTALARNVISGNTGDGLQLSGDNNIVQGNYIGIDATGTSFLGNGLQGIFIGFNADGNTIGGTVAGARNIISGNSEDGIRIDNATNTTIQGNYVGLNAAGTAAIGNAQEGINLLNTTTGTTIGGTAAGAGNVISGNDGEGVLIGGVSTGTVLQGNYIGTNAAGTAAVGNASNGVFITADGITVGGTTASARNIISGNALDGINVNGAANTTIQGNYIGTDVTGTADLGNTVYGINLQSATNTLIGGSTVGARNVIAGNTNAGIRDQDTSGTIIQGNYIGVDATGTAALGNSFGISAWSSSNGIIGGSGANEGNVIGGNTNQGILLYSSSGYTVQGNYIGTDATGTLDLGNGQHGITFSSTSTNHLIGGTGVGEGNVIAFSGGDGISVPSSGSNISILGNQIYTNTDLGIDLGGGTEDGFGVTANDAGDADTGANNLQNYPVLTNVSTTGTTVTIQGTLNSTANSYYRIEFFANTTQDGSGHGEAETYLGFVNVMTDGSGDATINAFFSVNVPAGAYVTATATKSDATYSTFSDTSEFALNQVAVVPNAAPTISNLGGDALAYTEGDGAVVIDQSSNAVVSDVDSANFDTGTLTVSFQAGSDSAEDVLAIRDEGAGPTNITVLGGTVSYGGTQIGTFTGGNGGTDLVITLDADADATAVSALIQNITYENTDTDNPTTGARTVRYVLTDGDGGTSANYDTTVTVGGDNDAPVVTASGGTTSYTEQASAVVIDSAITLVDVDGFDGADPSDQYTAVVQITGNYEAADVLGFTNTSKIQGNVVGDTLTLSVIGGQTATVAEFQAALRTVTFFNNSDTPSELDRTITFSFDDGVDSSNFSTKTVQVTAVNDQAVADLNGADGGGNNFATTFTEGSGAVNVTDTDATISDVDNTTYDNLGINLSGFVDGGSEQITVGGYTFTYGTSETVVRMVGSTDFEIDFDGSGFSIQRDISGEMPEADLQTLLRGITYENLSENPTVGNRTLDFIPQDGDALVGLTSTSTITVAATNDAPVVTSNGGGDTANLNVTENTTAVTTVTSTDVDGGTAVYTIIGGLDAAQFSINSSTGELVFLSAPDYETPTDSNGDNVYVVTVQVSDGNGGADTQMINVTVTDVANTLTVTTTTDNNDSGIVDGDSNYTIEWLNANMGADLSISLREAIIAANNTAGQDTIGFNLALDDANHVYYQDDGIANSLSTIVATTLDDASITDFDVDYVGGASQGFSWWRMQPTSELPAITDAVIIDGSTQAGWTAGQPVIEINGVLAGTGTYLDGLTLNSSTGSTIRGLVINQFDWAGIQVNGTGGHTIVGNFIGTDVTGTVDLGNRINGIEINSADNNVIGGTTLADRNIISGNNQGEITLGTSSTGNIVQGNYLGLDVTGSARLGGSYGLRIYGDSNQIGGTGAGEGNVIAGVRIESGGQSNVFEGNYVGTDAAGASAIGGVGYGFTVYGSNNVIGGTAAGAGNVISGNSTAGVYLTGTSATGNLVQGNLIGTDVNGTAALGNGDGVRIGSGASNNTIGGTTAGARNTISGNTSDGIEISGAMTTGNVVQGNYIGTDVTGTLDLGNAGHGIRIQSGASTNTIGGTTAAARNVIASNDLDGVYIHGTGTSGNVVQGNYIGIDATGTTALGNSDDGVWVGTGATGTTIGGTTAGAGNVISGNIDVGIVISGTGTSNTVVQGNYIGTDAAGTSAVANNDDGIWIGGGATNTTIGGTTASARNIISGNTMDGVQIHGAGTSNNVVQGNYIGVDVTGLVALANGDTGVVVSNGATSNTIGGATSAHRNVISGNTSFGVQLTGSGTDSNTVSGNYIGTDSTGTAALGNGSDGIRIGAGASSNTIGGTTSGERNIISGNTLEGINIVGAGTDSNVIQGNYIGTDVTGTVALGNTEDGIQIDGGAANNIIGGSTAGARNVISGNEDGIEIKNSSYGNVIQGNYIGTDATGTVALANVLNGIHILQSAYSNTIGGVNAGEGNLVAFNTGDGVRLETDAGIDNSLLGNAIHSNQQLGVDLGTNGVTTNDNGDGDTGANNLQNFPVLTSASTDGANLNVVGTFNSLASTTYRLEFFASTTADASGHGEAERYLGFVTVTTDGSGNATFNTTLAATVGLGEFITATATVDLGGGNYGSTSEFAANIAAANPIPFIDLDADDSSGAGITNFVNTFTEDGGPVLLADSDATLTDLDSATLASLTVTITNLQDGAFEVLAADTTGTSITASYDSGTGVLTLSGSDTVANYQQVLRTVTYDNTSDTPNTTTRVIQFVANDGTYSGNVATTNLTVSAVNDAPVINTTAMGTTENNAILSNVVITDPDGGTPTFSIIGGADAAHFTIDSVTGQLSFISSPDFEAPGDFDGDNVYEVTVQVDDGNGGISSRTIPVTVTNVNEAPVNTVPASVTATEDTSFAFTGGNLISTTDVDGNLASTQLTVSNGTLNVTLSGSATISAGANGSATLTISGSETDINATLASLTYQGTLNYTGADTLVVVSTDSAGTPLSDTDNVSITVDPVNDAPVNTVPASVTATEDTSFAFTGGNLISTTDVDGNLASTQLTVSNGTLNVTLSGSATISAGANGSATLTISGSETDINATLASLTYQGTLNYTGADTLVVVSTDSAGTPLSDTDNVSITVDPVNDAPVNTVPASVTATEDTSFAFTGGNLISTTDVDGNLASTQLTVSNGTLNVTLSGSATISAGANGSATLTISGSETDINATLASLTYQGTLNYTGADTLVVVSTDSAGTPLSDTDNVSITVDPVNDAPVNTVPASVTATEDTSFAFTGGNLISTTDVDGNLASTQLTVSNGTLNVTLSGSATISAGANGSATLTISGSETDINATLASLTYQGTLNYTGADTLVVVSTDSAGTPLSDTDNVSITVDPVNDAPVNTVPASVTATEDTSFAFTGGNLISTTDVDGNLASTQLTVSNGTLNVTLSGSATISAGANGSATLTISGSETDINATLASLTYQGTLNYTGADTLVVVSTDSAGTPLSDTDNVSITVDPVNDAPVNTVPASVTATEDTSFAFTGGNLISTTDVDGNLASTQLTVSNGTLNVTLSGSATISAGANGSATLTISGSETDINATLASLTYQGTLNYTGADTLVVVSTDSAGTPLSDTDNVSITVDPVNDAPVNTVPASVTATEDTSFAFTGGNLISTTDVDGNLASTQLTVSNGTLNVTLSGSATISAGANGSATLTISGSETDINATLASLTYQGTLNYTGADTLVVVSTDSAGTPLSDTDNVSITVDPVNDAPVNTVPASVTATEDTSFAFTGGNLISTTDVDGNLASTQLTVSNGTLNVTLSGSATISAGANGSATLTISGSETDINATLASLTYQGTLNYTGADTLVVVSTDSAGTPLSDTDNVSITVDPVNDAPVNTVPASVTATEDTSFAFTGGNLISTTDVDGNLASTQLTVSNGTLNVTLSGSATISAGANGSATLTISGSETDINATLASLTYQGTLNYTGADTLVVVSTDSAGTPLSDTDNVSITVDPVNDAPVNTVPASVTATEDTSFAFTGGNLISTTDVDGNLASTQLTVSNGTLNVTLSGSATISAGANGSATLTISGSETDINATLASLTYQGTLNYTGADTLVVVSTDGNAATDVDVVGITVTGDNDMPIITTSGGISIPEDTSGTMMLSINDPDAGSGNLRVTLTVSNGFISLASTTGLTFTTGDGTDDLTMTFEGTQADLNVALATITYTPDLNYFGSDTLSYSINDLGNTGGPANIFNGGLGITVTSVDDAAVITGDTIYTGNEGDAVAGDLNATDVDGLTDGTYFSVSTPASNGTASIDPATGTWTFTPTDPNWFGTDSFTVTVTDDLGGTTTQVISVTLANVDDAAVIGGQMSYSGNEGDVGSGTLTATDPDGLTDGTYFTVTTPATQGTAAIDPATGAWTFTPTDPNWFGTDSFTVTVTDDQGGTTTQVISVTLANVNDAPVNIVPGGQTVAEDTALNITGLSVTDVDGNLSTVQLSVSNGTLDVTLSGSTTISAGANGTNTLTLAGGQADINATLASLVYQGTLNYVGADTLIVQSTDTDGFMDVDVVTISVTGTNDAPVANDDSFTTPENTPISTMLATGVLVNDTDLDGDTLTVNTTPVVPVTNGTLVLNTDGSFTYTPNLGFSGLDSFTYEVTDGNGGLAQATVTITVMPVNSAPVITSHGGGASASISMAENLTNVAAMTATDPDGDPLTYSIVGGADAARFAIDSSTGVLEFVAAPDFENPMDVGSDNIYDVQVQVSDGQGGTATQTLAVGITDVMEGLVPPPVPEPTPDSPPEPMPEPEPTPEPDMEPETPAPLPSGVGGSGPSGVISEGVYVGLASRGIEGHVQNIDGRETVDVLDLPPLLRPSSWATTSDQIRSYYADPVDMTKAELPPEFLQQLTTFSDELEQTMEDQTGTRSWMVNMVKSTGLALSSGIVAWMVRGGTLVAGLMAAVVPAWRQFDPVPILGMDKKGQEAWTRRVKEAATMEAREHQGLDQILQATNQEPAAPSPSKPPSQSS